TRANARRSVVPVTLSSIGMFGPTAIGASGPSPAGASRSLQTLLSGQHVPGFGARVCVHPRIVAWPHDRVRENRSVALCCGELEWSDDGDRFASPRRNVSGTEFG